jgi:GntR family transcriptional repressor for pyruvate dehydrogenase complex
MPDLADGSTGRAPGLLRVSRVRLYELLAGQLVDHVSRAGLRPGDRLPAERVLAEQFGVSRASVRQALVALEVKGVVQVRHGGGVFLADAPRAQPLDSLLHRATRLSDILVVREALEVKIAELAALHCRDEDRRLLEQALARMDDDVARGGIGAEADAAFHRAVTLASRNPVMLELMEAVSDRIWESRIASLSQPGRPPVSLTGHRAIAAAIVRGDPSAAGDAMRAHLAVVATVDWAPRETATDPPDPARSQSHSSTLETPP